MQAEVRTVLGLFAIVLLAVAAWSDLATRTIPNRLCIGIASAGLLARIVTALPEAMASAAVAAGVFLVLILLHARGVLGGGDVKLSAAIVLGLSPAGSYLFMIVTILSGGLLALLHLSLRLLPRAAPAPAGASPWRRVSAVERWRIKRRGPLPYGIAIACGGTWAILSGLGV